MSSDQATAEWNKCEMGDYKGDDMSERVRVPMSYADACEFKENIYSQFERVVSIFEELQEALEKFYTETGTCNLDKFNKAVVAGFIPGTEWHLTRSDGVEMDLRFTSYLPFEKMRFLILDGEHKGAEQDAGVEIILRHIDWFQPKK